MRPFLSAILLTGVLSLPSLAQQQQQPQQKQQEPAAVPVGVVVAERRPVAKTLDFVGRVEAVQRVEVRARVKGYLEAVLFKEGDMAKTGDPLYHIEKGLFAADVEQAEGALARSTAAVALGTVQKQRAQTLMEKNAGTVVARDQAVAMEAQAKGQVISDTATLDTAKINLGYTDITSPIDGRVGRTNVTIGNVVGPDSGPLTVIVSQDPMYVTFPVSQREFLRIEQSGGTVDAKGIKVRLHFSDGSSYPELGQVNFIDVSVDRATDTILVRATFPNPKSALVDGQLVRVGVESGTPTEKVVVPQSALIADQEGVYVFVVGGGKAVVKHVKTGGEADASNVVVEEGLSGGEQVIVQGLQSVRAGTPVRATPVPQTLGLK